MSPGFLLGLLLLLPAAPEDTLAKARGLIQSGRPEDAVPALEAAVESRPKDPAALRLLGAAYALVGDDRFEATYRRALALAPENLPLRLELVEALWQSERAGAGNAEIARLLADAGGPGLHLRYAFELVRQERFADAAREFSVACRGIKCDAEALEMWGNALLETGRFPESAARYRESIARAPDRLSARQRLGRVLLLSGDPASARRELSIAAERQPDSPEILVDLGRALEAIGQPEVAEDSYRAAVRAAPNHARAHYALGALLARRGREEEARREIAVYQAAFEREQRDRFESASRRAEIALGWTELAAGRTENALAQFERHPESPEALRGLAAALSRLGRHAEAAAALERAAGIAPSDPRVRYALAQERQKAKSP